jgi:hypothetical protein
MQPNPAWVNRTLTQFWGDLERLVGEERMPLLTTVGAPTKGKRVEVEELGTGHYGTVMPTHSDGIVMKVTSDPTEAAFVASALSIGEFPDGIVRYERIVALPEKLRNRGVFVIWREEADDVGIQRASLHQPDNLRYVDEEAMRLVYTFKAAAALVREQKDHAPLGDDNRARDVAFEIADDVFRSGRDEDQHMRTSLTRRAPRGPFRAQVLYWILDWCFDMMENTNGVHLVGGALRFYFEDHGILLADVHGGNIGRAYRGDHGGLVNVITDPGHAVFVDDRYDGVRVPELPIGAHRQSAMVSNAGMTLLRAADVAELPVGSVVFPWKDGEPQGTALVLLPEGALTQIALLPKRAGGEEPGGDPAAAWGDSFALVSTGHGRLPTHGTAQRAAFRWYSELRGGAETATAAPLETTVEYAPAQDRNGRDLHPGDAVRFKLYPRGTATGIVTISERAMQVLPDGTTAPALAIDADGRVYSMPPPNGVTKIG